MRFRVLLTTVFTVLLALVAGLTTASLEFNSVVQAGENWNDDIRQRFIDFMNSSGFTVNHSQWPG